MTILVSPPLTDEVVPVPPISIDEYRRRLALHIASLPYSWQRDSRKAELDLLQTMSDASWADWFDLQGMRLDENGHRAHI